MSGLKATEHTHNVFARIVIIITIIVFDVRTCALVWVYVVGSPKNQSTIKLRRMYDFFVDGSGAFNYIM